MKFFKAKHLLIYCCSLALLSACTFTEFADYSSAYNMNATYMKDKSGIERLRITGLIATDQRGAGILKTQRIGKRLNVYIKLVPNGDFKVNRVIIIPEGVDEVYLGNSPDLLWIRSVQEKQDLEAKKPKETAKEKTRKPLINKTVF